MVDKAGYLTTQVWLPIQDSAEHFTIFSFSFSNTNKMTRDTPEVRSNKRKPREKKREKERKKARKKEKKEKERKG